MILDRNMHNEYTDAYLPISHHHTPAHRDLALSPVFTIPYTPALFRNHAAAVAACRRASRTNRTEW